MLIGPLAVASCGPTAPPIQPKVLVEAPKTYKPLERYHFPAVYFEPGQFRLTAQQQAALAEMGSAFLQAGITSLHLIGHTDGREGGRAAQNLSLRRAQTVAVELVKLGYRQDDLTIIGVGASEPRIADPDKRMTSMERFVLFLH